MDKEFNLETGLATSISKHFFFKIYKTAFDKSFTKETIQRAFEKSGLWPVNCKVWTKRFDKLFKSKSKSTNESKTSSNAPQVRAFRKVFESDLFATNVHKLFKALEETYAQHDLANHDIKTL